MYSFKNKIIFYVHHKVESGKLLVLVKIIDSDFRPFFFFCLISRNSLFSLLYMLIKIKFILLAILKATPHE
jgi:succinate-acetate transporter protein